MGELVFGVRHVSENESNDGDVRVVTDGVTLGDLMIGYAIQNINIQLNIRNITDEEYYGTCLARGDCFPGERRSVVGRVAYSF